MLLGDKEVQLMDYEQSITLQIKIEPSYRYMKPKPYESSSALENM